MSSVTTQLEAIHSMLSAGHRSIRMQPHSLILWGVTAGTLCLATEHIITPERFPEAWLRAVALLLFLGVVLCAVAVVDYQYTRHRIRARDESLPFVQAQVTKVLWLLTGMGVLFTFASAFFGAGYMIFVVWLVVFGLGLYVHGLFSEQILEWAGIMMIALGIGVLALPAPYRVMQWLAASAFGLGMPLLSTMLDRGQSKSAWTRALQSALWLAVVLTPPILAHEWWKAQTVPGGRAMSLESLRQQAQPVTAIVTLPAGTTIPLSVHVGGGVIQDNDDMTLPLTLARPLEVALVDGKPDGRFRVAGGEWKRRHYSLWIQHVDFGGTLEPSAGPAASLKFDLTVDH
jgi:hypothetical protein